ncbi:uncharacterized protein F5891DRAFT_1179913 [Suillus fuscotomentosus]|uniref:Uncharacterized protein n=1 Tax=Suillus fuscotomentosus TaxID=1912939 RepID=A0AAD4HTW8_9AGAM|nr:uncharacterized protein F5891DRAFT_1179913 [Suillus fuscotomentosus]KAG1908397.1 hypothetical protein F5891DRAFT_1179913 [Suillus fuscotomentosus]
MSTSSFSFHIDSATTVSPAPSPGHMNMGGGNSEVHMGKELGGEIHLIKHMTQGLWEALSDGRLVIGFTVMKCIGCCAEWFNQFLYYQAHPKPPTTQKRKEGTSRAKKPSAKRVKGSTCQREVSSESDSDKDKFSDVEDKIKVYLGSASHVRKSSHLSAKLVGVHAENAELKGKEHKECGHQHSQAQEAKLLLMSNKLFVMSCDWGMLEKEISEVVEE